MPKPTVREAIIAVLKKEQHPLSIKKIYSKILEYDYYRFNAEYPISIVAAQVRRHCIGIEFPSANKNKYFQILSNGTYWLKDVCLPSTYKEAIIKDPKETKKDPTKSFVEELKNQHANYTSHFKLTVLNQLKSIDPKIFESFSKRLLEVYGFREMIVTQYTKDGGIDGHGKLRVGITHLNVAFQSKRWSNTTVSKKEIQSFRGDIQGKFEHGIYFTTSTYSKDAKEVSIQKGAVPIILIDGNTIVDIMIEKRFGIEAEQLPVYINALDRALTEEI